MTFSGPPLQSSHGNGMALPAPIDAATCASRIPIPCAVMGTKRRANERHIVSDPKPRPDAGLFFAGCSARHRVIVGCADLLGNGMTQMVMQQNNGNFWLYSYNAATNSLSGNLMGAIRAAARLRWPCRTCQFSARCRFGRDGSRRTGRRNRQAPAGMDAKSWSNRVRFRQACIRTRPPCRCARGVACR